MSGGNYIAYNLGLNPAVNFNFMLRVEGVLDLPCKSIRAFQKENEYEMIQEGGLNDYVHLRRKPISKPFTIQVERYVGVDMLDPLPSGTELVLPLMLYVNRYSVYGEFHPIRVYVFSGCTVMSKEYGELNAEESGLLTEITTIAYREMYTIDNVATSFVTEDTWEFKEATKEGNGNRKANIRTDLVAKEESRQQTEKKAVLWKFNETTKEGNGVRRKNTLTSDGSNNINSEKTKSELQKAAKSWMFKDGGKYKTNQESNQGNPNNTGVGEAAEPPAFRGIGGSANHNDYAKNEIRKDQMKKASIKYDLSEDKEKNERAVTSSKEEYNYKSKEEMKKASIKYDLSEDKEKNERAVTSSKGDYNYKTKEEMKKASVKYDLSEGKTKNERAVTSSDKKYNYKARGEMEAASVKYDLSEGKTKNERAVTSSDKKYNYKAKSEMEKASVKYDLSDDQIKNERAVTSSKEEYKYKTKDAMGKSSVKYSLSGDRTKNKRAVTVEAFMKNGKI